MKRLSTLCVTLFALGAFAAEKPERPIPMNTRVDTIDVANKSFTHKNKDGREVKFVVTNRTTIRNGAGAARFDEIKVGDTVSGSRFKKSDTEYEVKSITKFGPTEAKQAKDDAKPAEKKS
jgi:hypothetical protein